KPAMVRCIQGDIYAYTAFPSPRYLIQKLLCTPHSVIPWLSECYQFRWLVRNLWRRRVLIPSNTVDLNLRQLLQKPIESKSE
ncbi:hypothetical protein VIGAN_03111500, partial [Vigna angularis var. angularis]